MKKKIIIILSSVIIALNILTVYASVSGKNEDVKIQEDERKVVYEYCVKKYNEKVAVFKYGNEEPVEIFDVYVSDFPESDRQLLTEGIYAKDEIELQSIIEDYTS